ncbi:MAG TPA: rhamnogalacturonan acetylesterase [Acidobacteriaceae bacterium]|nr:rhamnogalacturonan acetylesterase [Acidobacteriaceae bacterium]
MAVLLASAALAGQTSLNALPRRAAIKVVLVGDSTVAVQGGWGPGFCAHVISPAECLDLAVNGRSSKSYIDEGLWAKALEVHGQFYLIQCGHNDQKEQPALHTEPETTFAENLRRYIRDVREISGVPVLVTSLSRRNYKDGKLISDPLEQYAAATRKVAAEEHVQVIDLYALSRALLQTMTQQQADRYDATIRPDGKREEGTAMRPDRTHLNELGREIFGDMMARAALQKIPALRRDLAFRSSAEE